MNRNRVVVIGGAGQFGARICRRLAGDADVDLVVAGRDLSRGRQLVESLLQLDPAATLSAAALDHAARDFDQQLAALGPWLVIHTAGPFQQQSYEVARSCLRCRSHYIDLADGRSFVTGVTALDRQAQQARVLLTSGASTLPAVSAAVVDALRDGLESLEGVETAIVPANRTPRGAGTIAAVLSYCGAPFTTLESGRTRTVYGWQDLRRHRYPALGRRWLGACDVPDLELFPARYPGLQTVRFHAGLELAWQQWTLWLMAWLARARLVRDWSGHARLFERLSVWTAARGTDDGGMHVRIWGRAADGRRIERIWYLTARRNHGPEIPCLPAVVLARKLLRGELRRTGALPCLGLMSLGEFEAAIGDLDISTDVVESVTT